MTIRHEVPAGQLAGPAPPSPHAHLWRVLAGVEVALAVAAVALDLFLPALVILGLAAISLVLRREGPGSLGLHRVARPSRLAVQALALAVVWSLVNVGLTKPVLEHLTGDRQDVSDFAELEGNVTMLLVLLALSWTLAAFVETLAFTGFVQTRMAQLFGTAVFALPLSILASAMVFGFIHTEQGIVGVTVSTIDAAFYVVLRYRFGTLWAPILTHGFINTIGMVTFYVSGPFYGLW